MDHWKPRRSRPTSSFTHRRGSRRPSSPEFERARFKRSSVDFESYEKNKWPVENQSRYRDKSRSPFSDYDNFRGRSDRGRPFRGKSDRGKPFRGRSDRGRPFRGTFDGGRPFVERSYRGRSDRGGSFRGRSDRGRPFRGTSDRERPFIERGYRGRCDTERPERGRHFEERSHSRESFQSFQEKSTLGESKSRSRSDSRDRYYVMKPENVRYSDEEFSHPKISRSRSNSKDRLYFKESIENERYSHEGSFERANNPLRISRSRSNSRDRLHQVHSGEDREIYDEHNQFQRRKSRSRSNSMDRLYSSGHKVYYDQSFEIENDDRLRQSRSRSNSSDRLYPTRSIKNERFIDGEYCPSQSNYKPKGFRSRSNSRDRLDPSESVEFGRDELRLNVPSVHQLREPRMPSYDYTPSQQQSFKDGMFKEQAIYSHSKHGESYTSRADSDRSTSHERKCFIKDRVFDSQPKVYRLSSNFDNDLNEESSKFKNYRGSPQLLKSEVDRRVNARSESHGRDFRATLTDTNSPPQLIRSFENSEYYERKFQSGTIVSANNFVNQNKFTRQERGFQEDEFQVNQKRSFQDAFSERFDEEAESSQRVQGTQNQYEKKLLPSSLKKVGENKDKPIFQNITWHRGSAKNKNYVPQADLRDLSHIIIFFYCNASNITRHLWLVLYNSFRKCDLWLNCIENRYRAEYRNIYYCILKWKSRDLVRAEDIDPKKAKQKAGFMLINQLAQTNYTIKARPEYFCCSLDTLKQKYEPQGVCRFITHEEARGVVSGFKLIEDLFAVDKHVELIFGADEHKPGYLDGIKKFAQNKNFKYRLLTADSVSVSFDFSPEYIKKDLLGDGVLSDKFELIPPLGPGVNLLDDYNLTGFLPNVTKFYQGAHITKYKKVKNFIGKLKKLKKRCMLEKVTDLIEDKGDEELTEQLIDRLPPTKRRKLTNKLFRSSQTRLEK